MAEIVADGTRKTLTGGGGDDTLRGAAASENLNAGNGDDIVIGGGGDDKINGGAGIDTAVYRDGVDDVEFVWKDNRLLVATASEGTDTVHNVERLEFAGVTYSISGAVARADVASVAEDQEVLISVLANDLSLKAGAELFVVRPDGTRAEVGDLIAVTAEGAEVRLGAGGTLLFSAGSAYDGLAAGEEFATTFSYTIDNGTGGTARAFVTVTVTGSNDGPAVSAAVTAAAQEGAGPVVVDLLEHASDVDRGAVLQVANVSWAGGEALPAGFVLEGTSLRLDASSTAFDALAEGETATFTFSYDVVDEHGASARQTASVLVTGTDDAPVAQSASHSLAEDGSISGFVAWADVDGGPAAITLVSDDTAHGSLSFDAASGRYSYTPDANYFGAGDSFAFQVGGSNVATVSFDVTAVNDLASITGAHSGFVVEDGQLTASGKLSVADPDANEKIFAPVAAADLVGEYGDFTFADGSWTYTLRNGDANVQSLTGAGAAVYDTLIVHSADGTASREIKVAITGADEPPAPVESFGAVSSGYVYNKIYSESDRNSRPDGIGQFANFFHSGEQSYLIPYTYAAEYQGVIEFDLSSVTKKITEAALRLSVTSTVLQDHDRDSVFEFYLSSGDGAVTIEDWVEKSATSKVGSVTKSQMVDGDLDGSYEFSLSAAALEALLATGNKNVTLIVVERGGSQLGSYEIDHFYTQSPIWLDLTFG